jgi:phage portal protein BeeE
MPYTPLKWSKTIQDASSQGTYYQLFPDAKHDLQQDNADDFQRERYWLALNSNAPSQWLSDHLQESQRLTGAVYVAIKVLSDQASTADINFFEWEADARLGHDKEAKKPLSRSHPLCKLLHRPNHWDSRGMLLRRIVQQLCLTGSSLLWRIDDGMDMPRELWSIPTGSYQPVPISSKYPDGAYSIQTWFPGPLAYVPGITNPGGAIVSANNILVTRFPHPLVYNEGNSPLNACALPLDTIESIDRARFTKLRRGIYPSAIATLDGNSKMPEKNELLRMRTQINQAIGGPDKAGLPAVLAPGMKLEQYGSDKIEFGWIDSWNQLISFVLSIFGVTKSLAFMSEEASYASLYASLMQFNLFTMTPLLNLISDAINHQLVEPFFGENYCLELIPRPVHDEQMKETQYVNDYNVGLRTMDEMRIARGLGKAPWEDGSKQRAWNKEVPKPEEEVSADEGEKSDASDPNNLRASVGGSQALLALQQAVYSNPPTMPREAAIANVMLIYGFNREEAELLLPVLEAGVEGINTQDDEAKLKDDEAKVESQVPPKPPKKSEDKSTEPNSNHPTEVEVMKNSRPENRLGLGTRGPNKKSLEFTATKGWVTLESGTHILLGADGVIKDGPAAVQGRHIDDLKRSKGKQPPSDNKPQSSTNKPPSAGTPHESSDNQLEEIAALSYGDNQSQPEHKPANPKVEPKLEPEEHGLTDTDLDNLRRHHEELQGEP